MSMDGIITVIVCKHGTPWVVFLSSCNSWIGRSACFCSYHPPPSPLPRFYLILCVVLVVVLDISVSIYRHASYCRLLVLLSPFPFSASRALTCVMFRLLPYYATHSILAQNFLMHAFPLPPFSFHPSCCRYRRSFRIFPHTYGHPSPP